jgi:hypothetical protein
MNGDLVSYITSDPFGWGPKEGDLDYMCWFLDHHNWDKLERDKFNRHLYPTKNSVCNNCGKKADSVDCATIVS